MLGGPVATADEDRQKSGLTAQAHRKKWSRRAALRSGFFGKSPAQATPRAVSTYRRHFRSLICRASVPAVKLSYYALEDGSELARIDARANTTAWPDTPHRDDYYS